MLRPVFDRTVVRWLSLSLSTGSRTTGTGAVASQGHVARGSRSGQAGAHIRSGGFKQMSESDENLAWEMQGLGNQKRNTLPGHSSSASAESVDGRKGHALAETSGIAVTHTVTVDR
ncbi:integral membrane protein [Colletotrichum plurivorum]|uniref:Integral membrane protein n=1 Tax=Colletotrichum plurivorum TaxID=2175906 RepID=A0A8H6NDJ3_9PEZI|nr:integral membrane protein [Colletotrichum plurivorum]